MSAAGPDWRRPIRTHRVTHTTTRIQCAPSSSAAFWPPWRPWPPPAVAPTPLPRQPRLRRARRDVSADAANVTSLSRPIDQYVWVSCANGGAGEAVRVTGELHYEVQRTQDASGVFHLNFKSATSGLTAVGLTSWHVLPRPDDGAHHLARRGLPERGRADVLTSSASSRRARATPTHSSPAATSSWTRATTSCGIRPGTRPAVDGRRGVGDGRPVISDGPSAITGARCRRPSPSSSPSRPIAVARRPSPVARRPPHVPNVRSSNRSP